MGIERLKLEQDAGAGAARALAQRLRSLVPGPESVEASVREIIEDVRAGGDEAVLAHTRRLDTGGADPRPLRVGPEALDAAIESLPLDVVAGLQVAIANVAEVAQAGAAGDRALTLSQAQRVRLREVPVRSAAIYVPGGRAPYPSTVVMGVVTARAAGVLEVAVCSPPGPGGEVHEATLGACRLCGLERVYRMGGAQAVAALACGTASVERVDVIAGPGNLYVQEAKRLLCGVVGIDGFAGPSDLLVLLGEGASERDIGLAALDMLAQAEHGPGTIVAAVAVAKAHAQALAAELEQLLGRAGPQQLGVVALVEAAGAREALALANAFAPEHLQLIGPDVESLAALVTSAGCLFVGAASATAFGDYVAGSNHVLPTAGAARFGSMLSARHFRRTMAQVEVDPAGAAKLARAGAPIARAEGFEWHARSMEARIGDNGPEDG